MTPQCGAAATREHSDGGVDAEEEALDVGRGTEPGALPPAPLAASTATSGRMRATTVSLNGIDAFSNRLTGRAGR